MSPKSLHPESGYTCAQPGCFSHKLAEAEATFGPAAGTGPDQLATKGAVLWDSFKCYILWFLAFFGIYASSSVCVF